MAIEGCWGMKKKKEEHNELLSELVKHHIESYDYMVDYGLEIMLLNIVPVKVLDPLTKDDVKIWFGGPELDRPLKQNKHKNLLDVLYPFECRQSHTSYTGKLVVDVCFQYNKGAVIREKFTFGQLPVMLMSKKCHLRGSSGSKLISLKEESSEAGGYFIMNGHERAFRTLLVPKRNHPISVVRSNFQERREGYSDKAIMLRCVREDGSMVPTRIYYLNNGGVRLGFWINMREFMLPLGIVLKSLTDATDREMYTFLTCSRHGVAGDGGSGVVGERAKIILDELHSLELYDRRRCVEHLGESFRSVLKGVEEETSEAVAALVLREYVMPHVGDNHEKFGLLLFMVQKLFSFVDQTSAGDNMDSLQNQEVLLAGHLITVYLKEKMEDWLERARALIRDHVVGEKGKGFSISSHSDVRKLMEKNQGRVVCLAVENMLTAGRLVTRSGLGLQETTGLTVNAERLNYLRFISHLRTVHRGSSFTTMRTTTARKLLPESFGFLCPVHTPDGVPCGLHNHMTIACRVTSHFDSKGKLKDFQRLRKSIVSTLIGFGMMPSTPMFSHPALPEFISVLLDGRLVGALPSPILPKVVHNIRQLKALLSPLVPEDLEVGYVPPSIGGAYPGLYLFTNPSRLVRPVKNLSARSGAPLIELVGPFEQVYMEIRCPDGGDGGQKKPGSATHEEAHPTNMLSMAANLTPWSEHNQSPRNMYQCQMAKQTMGFPFHSPHRNDQKVYRLQTPQSPLVRTGTYTSYALDDYPLGTNAVVAVLSYTGYDMEDAMILNSSSVDRGCFHGQVYVSETVDLFDRRSRAGEPTARVFKKGAVNMDLGPDGLPQVGQLIFPDDPYCCVYDEVKGTSQAYRLKGSEPGVVDCVVKTMGPSKMQKATVRFRHQRNPVIGDKFSSRHGQKGVCSQLWPDVDMPFSAVTGMRPDLIINPHAFPSRMTIAMLLECIAAKGGSLNGKFMDATPFRSSVRTGGSRADDPNLVDELGSMLTMKGFNHHGLEVLHSGVYGTEMPCEVFIGPVYYQRLRHMVSDKFQVRSTGTVDQVTRQPVHGRKQGGGIRFGEMERDAVLAHGAAYVLHDRLHMCSDHHLASVCSLCGSLFTSSVIPSQKKAAQVVTGRLPPGIAARKITCRTCCTGKGMETISMPYIVKCLASELASMNIKLILRLTD